MVEKGVVVVDDGDCAPGLLRSSGLSASEQIANRPIVHHVVEALESAGATEVVVATSRRLAADVKACLSNRASRSGASIRYVDRLGPMNLAAALRVAAPLIGSASCIVHPANGLLGEQLDSVTARLSDDVPDVVVLVDRGSGTEYSPPARRTDVSNVIELTKGRNSLDETALCMFGTGALLRATSALPCAGGDIDLTLLERQISAAGGDLQVLQAGSWRRYTGDPFDLLELNQIALERLDVEHQWLPPGGNKIEGRVQIAEDAVIRQSVIVGPSLIGPRAQIVDAYIGPYTSIGAGARVEGAEVERSIIGAGASVTYVGGRLAISVIGRNARVFRDFSLPRALRLQVGDGTIVALC